jgi:transposase, IS5 family
MAVRRTGQAGFADALAAQAGLGRSATLDRIEASVDWPAIGRELADLADPSSPGEASYPPLTMFKALLLQAWHDLSDREAEAQLADRLSFRRFAGLSLEDPSPDHSVICRFRARLAAADRLAALFAALDRQLEAAGLILKKGVLIDATLIEAARARPSGPRGGVQSGGDPDAAFARKEGKPGSVYGYKAHVGVDQGSGLIRAIVTTPANVNDTTPADALIRGDERAVYADKAYDSQARRRALAARGIKPRILRRANKHHPELPARLKRFNALAGRIRAPVETTFAVFKQRMGLRRGRYLGLKKTAAQLLLAAIAFNIKRAAALTA